MNDSRTKTGISVLLVNWNSRDDLRACLRSLGEQTDSAFEIVVVDNGSEDDSVAMMRSEFPSVRIVEAGENLGFAEGCNRGIDESRESWVFALNNDTVADKELIASLRKAAAETAPDVGMLQAQMRFRDRPHLLNSTGILLRTNGSARDRDFEAPLEQGAGASEVFCPTGGAAMYRREMLDALRTSSGVFDRNFFMYWEDVDLGWRARLAGWKAVYVPSAIVYHAYRSSSKRRPSSFVSIHCRRNRLRSLVKNASWLYLLQSAPKTMADVASVVAQGGVSELVALTRAVGTSLRQRKDIAEKLRTPRRTVEQRWAGKSE